MYLDSLGLERISTEADDDNVSATQNSLVTEKQRQHLCTVCDKQFARKCNLRRHIQLHTGERRYQCLTCGKRYTTSQALSLHNATHYTENRFSCSYCELRFFAASQLYRHVTLIHTRKYKCQECGKCFLCKKDLLAHSQGHSGVKLFKCTVCDKEYTRAGALATHNRVHIGHRPYVCHICSKSFTRADGLHCHFRTHTREKAFKCSVCEKAFIQPMQLTNHMRTHTGAKPYKCTVCDKTFSLNSGRRTHMFIHCQDKPLVCPRCNNIYPHRLALHRHKCTGHILPRCRRIAEDSTDVKSSPQTDDSLSKYLTKRWSVRLPKGSFYQCPHCVEKFKCKTNVKLHVRYNHPDAEQQIGDYNLAHSWIVGTCLMTFIPRINWRQYYFVWPIRHDQAHSRLFRP